MATVEEQVRAWDARMQSFPTFEELRDVEYVRRSGSINMLTENVQRELYDRGRYAGVVWLERCKENRVPWQSHFATALAHYETKHGPVDTWFTSDLLDGWEVVEIDSELHQLRQRLADLELRRSEKSYRK